MIHQISDNRRHKNQEMDPMGFSIKLDSYTSTPLNLGEITISK